ncbi:MAG: hypothetical protein Q8S41_09950 [Lutibacter sp.]|nr:hypothetical protein [Lutibacter sp.]
MGKIKINRKRKLKNYLKIGSLLIGICILLINCQQNDEIIPIENLNQKKYTSKKITLQEIMQNENLVPFIKNIEHNFDYFKNTTQNKKIKSNDNLFTILTDEIIQVVTDSTETYTFRVETPTIHDSDFENFVIEKINNNHYAYYLYRYKRVEIGENSQMDYHFSKQIVDSRQINFGDFQEILNNRVDYWASIDCWVDLSYDSDGLLTITYLTCGGAGGGGGTDAPAPSGTDTSGGETWDTTGDSTTGGGSSSSTSDGSSSSGSSTSPVGVILSPTAIMLDTFFDNLTPEQKDCLKSQFGTSLHSDIKTFLIENFDTNTDGSYAQKTNVSSRIITSSNNWTFSDAQNFAKLVLDNCGSKVDWVDKIIIDPSFENSKAYCAYKLLRDNNQFNQILDKLIPKNSKYSVTFQVGSASGNGGSTIASYGPLGNIRVTIDEDLVATGNIVSIAETILHESVHARLYEMVKSISGGLAKLDEFTYEDSEIGKLAACYNKYGNIELQHEFIWQNYVDEIAKGTEAIHKLFPDNYTVFHNYMQGTDGYTKETFYQSVAKASLNLTSYFKNLDITTQTNVLNMYSALKANGKKITNAQTCQ